MFACLLAWPLRGILDLDKRCGWGCSSYLKSLRAVCGSERLELIVNMLRERVVELLIVLASRCE